MPLAVAAFAAAIVAGVAYKARRHLTLTLSLFFPLAVVVSFTATDHLFARSRSLERSSAGLTVTITAPVNGTVLVQNPPVTIVVKWCGNGGGSLTTHNVFLDGALVGGAVAWPPPSGCSFGGTTTVNVSPQFGSHTVTAVARDNQNRSASATSTFTLQRPTVLADYRPEITPDAATKEVPLGAGVRDSFTVRNVGTLAAQYQVGVTCTGASCTSSPTTVTLSPGALGYVRVNYTTPGVSGQVITLSATATYQDPTLGAISDAGDLTVTTAPAAALYQPSVVPLDVATSGPPGVEAAYGFTLANTGRERATYSLNWWGTFGVVTTQSPEGALIVLDPGRSTRYNVAAKAPPDGQTGHLWLEMSAVYGGDEPIAATNRMSITGLSSPRTVVVMAQNGATQLIQSGVTTQAVPFIVTNVTAVDRTFTYTSTCSGAATNCRYTESGGAVAEQTVTIPAGVQRSVNVYFDASADSQGSVRLQAYETAVPTNIDAATVTLSRELVAGGVRINAVGIQTARNTNETFTQRFYIVNTGGAAAPFNYTSSTSGSVFQTCGTGSGTTASLQPADSTDVSIQCTTVSAHGQSGALILTASNQSAQASASVPTTTALGAGAEVNVHDLNPGPSVAREQCLTVAVGDNAAYECGQLRVVHPLPSTTTMGQTFTPTLVHTNHNVELINANVTFGPNVVPDSIRARVYKVLSNESDTPISFAWRREWSNGMPRRIVVPFSVWTLNMNASGAYRYRVGVEVFTPESTFTISDTATYAATNRLVSPFGALWWLDGLERLRFITPDPNQIFWVGGDGSTRLYTKAMNPERPTWFVSEALDRPDSLTLDGTTYKRHLRGGAWVEFDLAGLHVATVNARGHRTVLSYTGELLATITLPTPPSGMPRIYTFTYGGTPTRLMTVTAPDIGGVQRQVIFTDSLDYFGLPHIMAIRDPDNLVTKFEYAAWPMSARIDKRGVRTTFEFNYEMLRRATIHMENAADNIVHTFCAAEWASASTWFAGPNACAPSVMPVDSVWTWVDGPRSDVPDTTWFSLNRWGGPSKIVNALHDSTVVERTDSRWPLLPTALIQPNSHRVEARYTSRGLLDTLLDIDPLGDGQVARTHYQWNNFDKVDLITRPTGETTRFGYNTDGDREWQEDGRGALSRTSFTYNAQRQLETTRPAGKTNSEVYRFEYDPLLGNLQREIRPMGAATTYHTDAIGRVDMITSPANDNQERIQTFVYDSLDRVRIQRDIGPAVTHARGTAPAVTLVVTTQYDAEGNTKSIERKSDPDLALGRDLRTEWTYDNAGRKLTEFDYSGRLQRWSYDPASNVKEWTTGRSTGGTSVVVRTEYDTLNRPIRRTSPDVTRAAAMGSKRAPWMPELVCEHPARFPYFTPGLTYDPNVEAECDLGYTPLPPALVLPADVALFTYDKLGNIKTANNNDARITRVYYPNGALKTETQAVAIFDENTPLDDRFTAHRYQLDYAYDLSGRRVARTDNVPRCGGCVQTYHYDQASGFLDEITDAAYGYSTAHFGFQYDSIGRLVLQTVNGTRSTKELQYDNDSRLITRQVSGSSLIYRDVLTYDRSARITSTSTESDVLAIRVRGTSTAYNGLGALAYFSQSTNNDFSEDAYVTDGLGNRVSDKRWFENKYTARSYRYDVERLSEILPSSEWQAGDPAPPQTLQVMDSVHTDFSPTGSVEYSYSARFRFDESYWKTEAVGSEWTWNAYDGEERLRVTQRSTQTATWRPKTVFTEYRYDALGRRVAARTRWDQCQPALPGDCLSTIGRTIWDGDQILAEVRSSVDSESDAQGGAFYGAVRYTHGGGIDEPLAVWKSDLGGVIPHRTWRGTYEAGTPIDPNGTNVSWPARAQDVFFAADIRVTPIEPTAWIGSLVDGKTEPSGLMYMRNRYYDPKTGRFTQGDPIGLAGGMNLYGFAVSDPVNHGDPFGLCPKRPCPDDVEQMQAMVDFVGRISNAIAFGWLLGTATDAASGLGVGVTRVSNPIPTTFARVIPAGTNARTLARASETEAFVTDAAAIEGLSYAELKRTLGIRPSESGYDVFTFPSKGIIGIASPINRTNPLFVGRGRTVGGAPEYIIPNIQIPADATRIRVRP